MGKVFDSPGIVKTDVEAGYTCVVIQGQGKTYFQQAPILGIRIDQQVDFSLAKTLAGNFNLVTFQDLPVTINISGMRSLYDNTCKGSKKSGNIAQLYKSMKVSKSGKAQTLNVVIGGTDHYKAVIVALTEQSDERSPGLLSYSLTLFGVRTDK